MVFYLSELKLRFGVSYVPSRYFNLEMLYNNHIISQLYNYPNSIWTQFLAFATDLEDKKLADFYLSQGEEIRYGLISAATFGKLEMLKYFLSKGAMPVDIMFAREAAQVNNQTDILNYLNRMP